MLLVSPHGRPDLSTMKLNTEKRRATMTSLKISKTWGEFAQDE